MKYFELKGKEQTLHVSKLAIGSAMKMSMLSNEEVFEIFDIFLDAGGNCIDTARAYFDGRSEEMIGQYMKLRGNRDKIVLATKGCHPGHGASAPRLSRKDMEDDLNASLKALGTDHVDIYWIHKDDPSVPVEGVIDGINALIRSGKAGIVGCSNWHVDRIEKANAYAQETGQEGFAMSQIQWTLGESDEEKFKQFTAVLMDDASYDWYLANGMPVFSFSPQAQGFFSQAAKLGVENLEERMRYCYASEKNLKRLESVKALAQERGVPISVPVLAYLLNNKLPCIPVFGATTKAMVYETLQAVDFKMTAEEADRLWHCC